MMWNVGKFGCCGEITRTLIQPAGFRLQHPEGIMHHSWIAVVDERAHSEDEPEIDVLRQT